MSFAWAANSRGGVICESIQEPRDIHTELAGASYVLSSDIGLCTVGRHPDRADS